MFGVIAIVPRVSTIEIGVLGDGGIEKVIVLISIANKRAPPTILSNLLPVGLFRFSFTIVYR